MEEQETGEGLREFLSGSSDFDSKKFAEQVRHNPALAATLRRLAKYCRPTAMPDKKEMWNRVHAALRRRRYRRLWIRSAAAMLLLSVGLSLMYWKIKGGEQAGELLAGGKQEPRQVQLFLARGEVVDLTTLAKDTLIVDNGAGIQINPEEGLTYLKEEATEEAPVWHLLRVPRGCEYHLILSDATEVWLNSESELYFPAGFSGEERKLHLKGEAYFKVSRDTLHPFRVAAGEMVVEVLGTSFNVNAYRDDGAVRATLVEGSVRVRDTLSDFQCVLQPRQQAVLCRGKGKVSEVRLDEVVNWKQGRFLFRELPLGQIARQLERWYDVEITFREEELQQQLFTGIIKRYHTLDEVCLAIEETGRVGFERKGSHIVLYRKK